MIIEHASFNCPVLVDRKGELREGPFVRPTKTQKEYLIRVGDLSLKERMAIKLTRPCELW
jgi:hypothetical protein